MTPLLLRPQSRQEARLRQQIGGGLRYPFDTGEIQLCLTPEPVSPPQTQTFSCHAGLLHMTQAEAICALLSACPLLPEPGENAAWYWPLFNQHLNSAVQALFGSLMLNDSQPAEGLWLSIRVISADTRVDGLLCLLPSTLTLLLQRPGWQALPMASSDALPLLLPFKLGTLSFPLATLRTLRPDDVVFPATSYFSPSGQGTLCIAQARLAGELLCEEGHPVRFYITDLENTYVNLTPEDYAMGDAPQPDDSQGAAAHVAASPFDSLPLALTLRCGHLKLTLGELNRLDVGSTITVDHVVPGEALLCHGEFPLAKGELVNVEGRLGLQITHMLPGVASLLDMDR